MFKKLFCSHYYQSSGEYQYGDREYDYSTGKYYYRLAHRFICVECGKEKDFSNSSKAVVFETGEKLKRKHKLEKVKFAQNKELQDEILELKNELREIKKEIESSKVVVNLSRDKIV